MFEYKVVPAPQKGLKARGVKGTPARFANALQAVMNDMGADGWEYQRTDTLPVEERQGLTGKTTTFQNMLIFRRSLPDASQDAPAVQALIEDQTDAAFEMAEGAPDQQPDERPNPADEDMAAQDQPDQDSATDKRVSDTLDARSVVPLGPRDTSLGPANNDDDSQSATR